MKKLYIIRHAKSSWKDVALEDFERGLSKRGKANAPMMGERLKKKGVMPDIIISSPAKRAKTTAEIIAKEVGYKNILFLDDIYEATSETLSKIVKRLDESYKVIFLVGHNPSLNELAYNLAGFNENIPTCGIVEIEFKCKKWVEIAPVNAKLAMFDYPKKGGE